MYMYVCLRCPKRHNSMKFLFTWQPRYYFAIRLTFYYQTNAGYKMLHNIRSLKRLKFAWSDRMHNENNQKDKAALLDYLNEAKNGGVSIGAMNVSMTIIAPSPPNACCSTELSVIALPSTVICSIVAANKWKDFQQRLLYRHRCLCSCGCYCFYWISIFGQSTVMYCSWEFAYKGP